MADAKISALPRASLVSSDIIPFTVVSTSVTSGISKAELFTVTGASITSGTLTRGIIVSPSVTGGLEFTGALVGTGASITGATLNQPVLASPSITGNMEALGTITALGNIVVSGAASALGYTAGAGGIVAQSIGGAKEAAISLNRAVGKFTLSNIVLQASVITSVLFGNSVMGVTDVLVLNYLGNGRTGANMRYYSLSPSMVSPGAAVIQLTSHNNFADTSSIFGAFAVIKGAIT